jgi:hypothetical protein
MPPMSSLDDYYTEDELARLVRKKTGKGTERMLREWRRQRIGPPWAYLGRFPIYPKREFRQWLHGQVQRSLYSRARMVRQGGGGRP